MILTTPMQEGFAELLFDTARENGDAAGRYAALALAYGQGRITAQQAAEAATLITCGEARRGMELALRMGVGWTRWWASLWQAGWAAVPLPVPVPLPLSLPAPPIAATPLLAALDRP